MRKGPVAAQCCHGGMTMVTAQTWRSGMAGPPAGGNNVLPSNPQRLAESPSKTLGMWKSDTSAQQNRLQEGILRVRECGNIQMPWGT